MFSRGRAATHYTDQVPQSSLEAPRYSPRWNWALPPMEAPASLRSNERDGRSSVCRSGIAMPSGTMNRGRREALFQAIVENGAYPIALLDLDGTIRSVTDSISRLSGYTADQLIGHRAFELVHPDDRAAVAQAFARVLEQPGQPVSIE